ncbi:MAG: hypothetical protein ACJ741_04445 [Pyrinomonadaceae bacterium]
MEALLLLLAKFIAYSAWCYLGFHFFRTPDDRTLMGALGLGFVRFVMGFFAGIVILVLIVLLFKKSGNSFDKLVLAYATVFVPVRLAEWALVSKFYWKAERHANTLLWVAGGAVISCMSDIPYGFDLIPLNWHMC